MALWDIEDTKSAARESKNAGGGKPREYAEGAYHLKFVEMKREKSQKGFYKWIITWQFLDAENQENKVNAVGGKKVQHFNTGLPDKDKADSFRRELLLCLELMGVDTASIANEGALMMTAEELENNPPVMCYYIKPQSKPKYLDWFVKGKVQEDGETVIGLDGQELGKWGLPAGSGDAPAAVVQEQTSNDSEDLGL